jgi:hypothetical protein
VTSAEVVTLRVQNINGDGQQHGDVPFGFLTADVNGNRKVDKPDKQIVTAAKNQPVTSANFRDDINLSGVVDKGDLDSVNAPLSHLHPTHYLKFIPNLNNIPQTLLIPPTPSTPPSPPSQLILTHPTPQSPFSTSPHTMSP